MPGIHPLSGLIVVPCPSDARGCDDGNPNLELGIYYVERRKPPEIADIDMGFSTCIHATV